MLKFSEYVIEAVEFNQEEFHQQLIAMAEEPRKFFPEILRMMFVNYNDPKKSYLTIYVANQRARLAAKKYFLETLGMPAKYFNNGDQDKVNWNYGPAARSFDVVLPDVDKNHVLIKKYGTAKN